MRPCSVPCCPTQSSKGHRFPSNRELLKTWLEAIKRTEESLYLSSAIVCRRHFLPSDYALPDFYFGEGKISRLRLKRGAIPSQFDWNEDMSFNSATYNQWLNSTKKEVDEKPKKKRKTQDEMHYAPVKETESGITVNKLLRKVKDPSEINKIKAKTKLTTMETPNVTLNELTPPPLPTFSIPKSLTKYIQSPTPILPKLVNSNKKSNNIIVTNNNLPRNQNNNKMTTKNAIVKSNNPNRNKNSIVKYNNKKKRTEATIVNDINKTEVKNCIDEDTRTIVNNDMEIEVAPETSTTSLVVEHKITETLTDKCDVDVDDNNENVDMDISESVSLKNTAIVNKDNLELTLEDTSLDVKSLKKSIMDNDTMVDTTVPSKKVTAGTQRLSLKGTPLQLTKVVSKDISCSIDSRPSSQPNKVYPLRVKASPWSTHLRAPILDKCQRTTAESVEDTEHLEIHQESLNWFPVEALNTRIKHPEVDWSCDNQGSDVTNSVNQDNQGSDVTKSVNQENQGSDVTKSVNQDYQGSAVTKSVNHDNQGSDVTKSINQDNQGSDVTNSVNQDGRENCNNSEDINNEEIDIRNKIKLDFDRNYNVDIKIEQDFEDTNDEMIERKDIDNPSIKEEIETNKYSLTIKKEIDEYTVKALYNIDIEYDGQY